MTYEELKDSKYVLFKSIRGSHLYGLETPESDIDTYSVFCCPQDWLYGTGLRYSKIIGDDKNDNVISELTKYFTELGKSNPDALISLFTPEDKIIYKNPILQPLFDIKESLLTKQCFKSFKGYAKSQIGKAKGLNKAMNIDPDEVKERKTPIDFCWVHKEGSEDVWCLEKWLRENGLKQEHCGLVRLSNGVEFYVLYYDWFADKDLKIEDYARLRYGIQDFESAIRLGMYYQRENGESYPISCLQRELEEGKKTTMIKYRGIIDPSSPDSTQLRLSSVTKADSGDSLICFQYNMNAFSSHCRKYKEYHDWVKHRNPKRYQTNLGHSYDCYLDEETEFLTNHGWKKYDEVNDSDLVGCFDKDLKLVFEPFISRTDDLYTGPIYTFENRAIRFSVTPNHKLFIKQRGIGKNKDKYDWGLVKVQDFNNHGPSRVSQVKFLTNPLQDNPNYSDEFITLLGYYISEGSVIFYKKKNSTKVDKTRPYGVKISNMEGGSIIPGMRKLMNSFNFTEHSYSRKNRQKKEVVWFLYNKSIISELLKSGIGSLNKHLPDYVWTFSTRQINILIEALIQGDGYTHGKGHQIYYTFSYQLAKDLHTILNLNGRFAQLYGTKTPYKNDDPTNFKLKSGEIHNSYQVFISKNTDQEVIIEKSSIKHSNTWKIEEVSNKRIVCFETKFGTLVTRNKDKLAFHGNSKNCCHCLRLLTMAKEIASGEGMILDRRITGDRDLLLDVKTHKYSYDEVMGMILKAESEMEEAFKVSNLPEEPDLNQLEDIMIKIRHDFYDTQGSLIDPSQIKSLPAEFSKMVDENFWELT